MSSEKYIQKVWALRRLSIGYPASAENSADAVPQWTGNVIVKGVPISIGAPPTTTGDGF